MGKQYFFTNAEESLDYHYVQTVCQVESKKDTKHNWRLIEVSDIKRFRDFQLPRYGSGLKQAYKVGSEDADYYQLPSEEEIEKFLLEYKDFIIRYEKR